MKTLQLTADELDIVREACTLRRKHMAYVIEQSKRDKRAIDAIWRRDYASIQSALCKLNQMEIPL